MAMKPGLRVHQTQRLTLTPALRQSITILGLSSSALDDLIAHEIEQNPLMMLENDRQNSGQNSGQKTTKDSFQFATDTVAVETSLIEKLHAQITIGSAPGKAQQLALYLAGNLTDQGFLADTPETITTDLGLDPELVDAAIGIVQSCEPTGIGAFGLRHCLAMQLAASQQKPEAQQFILENLDDFARQDWAALGKTTGLPKNKLRELADVLRTLNPYPAEELAPQTVEFRRPDVKVSANRHGGFDVELTGSVAPVLRVDQPLFDTTVAHDPTAQKYLQSHLDRSNALIRAIEARSKTILLVCQKIVATQHAFFSGGKAKLVPQTRKNLAEALDLHPSTISRATANKSLECPFGIFPLKFFFTSSLESLDDAPARSAYVVQQEIRKLVNAETPERILSDERITALLRQAGIDIRRRTVAKYRQCLNIPTSAQRRRSKKVL
ncbi:MAG: RNA polymerase factor sigma-54 [Alphaproteobacteria bacterium]|nr:RNA polymerase factor sigma-54 [Alphaproteobacteria bacterium]